MGIWGRRVVAIDDDRDTLDILALVLRERGAEVVAVDHPGAALATILGVMPDVLLVDMAMPGLDGLSLIRKLRSLSPERGGRIPAAIVSAVGATEGDLAEWRAAGFQRHVRKPFLPDEIVGVVDTLAGTHVERRGVALDRKEWPTPRERRAERRVEVTTLRGVAGGDFQLLRELALTDGGELG
jgi:CheY-like chemotaxis protein